MMKRLIAVGALALSALTGCTRAELDAWVQWYKDDPAAAEAFANQPEIQAQLHARAAAAHTTNLGRWEKIAMCESGGNWSYPPVRGGLGHLYSGGLMIWQAAWINYGGQQFAGWAYQATRNEQIVVAERILADQGWGAWDCA